MLQSPHLAVRWLGYLPEEGGGVYISRWSYGSPAQKYGKAFGQMVPYHAFAALALAP